MKRRRFPCHRPGCRKRTRKLGSYCSRSCNRIWHLMALQTPEQRQAQMKRARDLQHQQEINRMLLRVKALADTEDERLMLAWRYGKAALKSARYRQKVAAA